MTAKYWFLMLTCHCAFGRSNASTMAGPKEEADRQSSFNRLVGGGNRLNKSSGTPSTAPSTAPASAEQQHRLSQGTPNPSVGAFAAPISTEAGSSSALAKIGSPDFAGYMKKKGERYNTWKTRYFVLKGAHLYYMKSPQEDKVKGHIDLTGYKVLSDPNSGSGFGFKIIHEKEKTHAFSSNDDRVVKDWMKNLMKATISRDYSGEFCFGVDSVSCVILIERLHCWSL